MMLKHSEAADITSTPFHFLFHFIKLCLSAGVVPTVPLEEAAA